MKFLTITGLVLALCGCASAPTVESIVTDGGEVVEGGVGSLIGAEGVTLKATDSTWTTYLTPDGTKHVYIKPLNAKEVLTWRRKDDGTFCETMYKPRKELCDSPSMVLIKRNDGIYNVFTEGKIGKYPFTVKSGNSEDF